MVNPRSIQSESVQGDDKLPFAICVHRRYWLDDWHIRFVYKHEISYCEKKKYILQKKHTFYLPPVWIGAFEKVNL